MPGFTSCTMNVLKHLSLVNGRSVLRRAQHCEHSDKQEDHHLRHVGQHVRRAPDGGARGFTDVLKIVDEIFVEFCLQRTFHIFSVYIILNNSFEP